MMKFAIVRLRDHAGSFLLVGALCSSNFSCNSRDVVAVAVDATSCESGCVCESFEGNRYMFCTLLASWEAADSLCVAHGARIVRVDSAEENTWIRETADANGMARLWIGANDRGEEGVWGWPDGALLLIEGADGGAPRYHNFPEGEPNQGQRSDCASMYESSSWHDQPCDSERGFVCKGALL